MSRVEIDELPELLAYLKPALEKLHGITVEEVVAEVHSGKLNIDSHQYAKKLKVHDLEGFRLSEIFAECVRLLSPERAARI